MPARKRQLFRSKGFLTAAARLGRIRCGTRSPVVRLQDDGRASGVRSDCSRGFALEIGLPLAERRKPVHFGAMAERALRGGDVFRFARPSLLRRRLQRAAIGESQMPGQGAELVHGVEMRGRFLVRLAAGQERDAGHRGRHAGLEQRTVFSATSSTEARLADFLPGTTMFGLSTMPSSATR